MSALPTPYTIAVVGAASGIGRAATALMARRGATIVYLDRDDRGARAAAEETMAAGGKASSSAMDILDKTSQKTLWNGIIQQSGQLHAVVNCAGVTGQTNIKAHDVDLDDFDRPLNNRGKS